jgi:hypothetical protein
VSGGIFPVGSAKDPKPPRYYVLEILATVQNRFGEREPGMWTVASSSFRSHTLAWEAAAEMRARHPTRIFIAGELCLQFLPP